MARINGIQRAIANKPSNFLLNLENELLRVLDVVLNQDEELWTLKSRVNWMIKGDRNTTFNHISTLVKRKRNQIIAIKNVVGEWIYEENDIKDFIRSRFDGIYSMSLFCASRSNPIISQWQPRLFGEERTILVEVQLMMRLKLVVCKTF